MNLYNKDKDILNIRLGHEADCYAIDRIGRIDKNATNVIGTAYDVYGDGFKDGIRFLANYLQVYGISVEMNDEIVKPTAVEDWYSGTVVDKTKRLSEEQFKGLVTLYADNRPYMWRLGQAVFNYIDQCFGISRQVSASTGIDCFYDDTLVDRFIDEAYKIYSNGK